MRALVSNCRRANAVGLALALGLALAGGGCRRAASVELEPVEGRVWLGGRPVQSGAVSFYPLEASAETPQLPLGSIEADGTYRIYYAHRPGCPRGAFRVVVFANEPVSADKKGHAGLPRSLIAARYNSPVQTPLRLEVVKSPQDGQYDLRLEP
jgi:hypothetical protein